MLTEDSWWIHYFNYNFKLLMVTVKVDSKKIVKEKKKPCISLLSLEIAR